MADFRDVLERLKSDRVCDHLLTKLKYAQAASRAALSIEMDKIGLTTPQFLAMALIAQNEDVSSAELARQSFVTPQAMMTIVARLEAAGLITRAPASGGGRSLAMRLTDKGDALLEKAKHHAFGLERFILETLGPEKYDEFVAALDRITDALSEATTVTKTTPWDEFVPTRNSA